MSLLSHIVSKIGTEFFLQSWVLSPLSTIGLTSFDLDHWVNSLLEILLSKKQENLLTTFLELLLASFVYTKSQIAPCLLVYNLARTDLKSCLMLQTQVRTFEKNISRKMSSVSFSIPRKCWGKPNFLTYILFGYWHIRQMNPIEIESIEFKISLT